MEDEKLLRALKEKRYNHDSDTWIASSKALISKHNFIGIFYYFKSLLIASSHIKFDRPLHLFTLLSHFMVPLRSPVDMSKPFKSVLNNLFLIGATPSRSYMSSFLTRSNLVCPYIQHNICISATLSSWICRRLVGQHSAPYNIAGLIVVL
jgi:hypothetical protein